jgi:hypothetical protein
LVWLLVTQLG